MYSLEPPHRSSSNEYPQSVLSAEIRKIEFFLSENFLFLEVKISIYLNRCVFIMTTFTFKKFNNTEIYLFGDKKLRK